jgi:hypothetical protein
MTACAPTADDIRGAAAAVALLLLAVLTAERFWPGGRA